MLNKVLSMIRRYHMIDRGDRLVCAVSGGSDSMALLWAMYLLREKLGIRLEAAHFDHGIRGGESRRDAEFVREFCRGYNIPFHCGTGNVVPGEKGLEAAARDARYAYLNSLEGKIATAHTADDNAETVLMHMIRGTGLKGLGGITPKTDKLIRPMLGVTKAEVLAFLADQGISYVEDSTNASNAFMRNRIRRGIMPLLREENPGIAGSLSNMALELREDEVALEAFVPDDPVLRVSALRELPGAILNRRLDRFLRQCGLPEPERRQIESLRNLVYTDKPSARADYPFGIVVRREYDLIRQTHYREPLAETEIGIPGTTVIRGTQICVSCAPADKRYFQYDRFTIRPMGKVIVRQRLPGDEITLSGGRKSLKKLFIDRKIPALERDRVPVLADDGGLIAVYGIGADIRRVCDSGICVAFQAVSNPESISYQ